MSVLLGQTKVVGCAGWDSQQQPHDDDRLGEKAFPNPYHELLPKCGLPLTAHEQVGDYGDPATKITYTRLSALREVNWDVKTQNLVA
jgi:hypothetical protein